MFFYVVVKYGTSESTASSTDFIARSDSEAEESRSLDSKKDNSNDKSNSKSSTTTEYYDESEEYSYDYSYGNVTSVEYEVDEELIGQTSSSFPYIISVVVIVALLGLLGRFVFNRLTNNKSINSINNRDKGSRR